MSDLKMSEVFPEAFQVEHNKSFEVQNCHYICFGESFHTDGYQDAAIETAVLAYDSNQELIASQAKEVAELKSQIELLKDMVKTPKPQFDNDACINGLILGTGGEL